MNAADYPTWEFEPADPEVGFLSDSLWHTCANNLDDPAPAEVDDIQLVTVTRNGRQEVAETTRYRCPTCGATTAATEHWPMWMFEPGD